MSIWLVRTDTAKDVKLFASEEDAEIYKLEYIGKTRTGNATVEEHRAYLPEEYDLLGRIPPTYLEIQFRNVSPSESYEASRRGINIVRLNELPK